MNLNADGRIRTSQGRSYYAKVLFSRVKLEGQRTLVIRIGTESTFHKNDISKEFICKLRSSILGQISLSCWYKTE